MLRCVVFICRHAQAALSCGGMKKSDGCSVLREILYICSRVARGVPDKCGSSSVGRALASQAKGHGFESRLPLWIFVIRKMTCIFGSNLLIDAGLLIL